MTIDSEIFQSIRIAESEHEVVSCLCNLMSIGLQCCSDDKLGGKNRYGSERGLQGLVRE